MEQELLTQVFKDKLNVAEYENLLKKRNNVTDEWLNRFIKYYRLRMSLAKIKQCYQDFSKLNCDSKQDFEKVLHSIGGCKKAVASKIMTVFFPDKPILDRNVAIVFNGKDNLDTVQKTVDFYNGLTKWYEDYLKTEICKKYIIWFNSIFPNNEISKYKKVDYLLWVIGGIADTKLRNCFKENFSIKKWEI